MNHSPNVHDRGARFATTLWNIVTIAGQPDGEGRDEALAILCRTYWLPIYAYIRRRGHIPADAEDLTQEFFARLLAKEWLAGIEPQASRFRSFLLTAVARFLANEHDRTRTLKRGGGQAPVSLDEAEQLIIEHDGSHESPEATFDRRWALTVLDRALMRLRDDCGANGKVELFERLNVFLSREPEAGEYAELSQHLGISPGAIGVSVHRLRQRYRESVRQEIASTLANEALVEEEMCHLLAALQG